MVDQLTSRERVRLALEHTETDRVPIAMVCSGINEPAAAAFDDLLRRTRGITRQQYLADLLDVVSVAPGYAGPPLPPHTDIWGVVRTPISYGPAAYNEITCFPLAQATDPGDVTRHTFPSTEWFDYAVMPDRVRQLQADRERCLMIANANVFECAWYMRGFEQIFMDMIAAPELAHAILRRVTDFHKAHFRCMLEAVPGKIDLAFTADDIGGQNGLLMSLDMWAEFVKPYHMEINQVIHEHGAKVIYHSDGAVMDAVPGLIDMGIDVLQALQFDAAGMNPVRLKSDYGDRLCFEGGVSVQHTLPFGNVDDVRTEVTRLISVLGRNGGYILGPAHVIQAGTPPENILAMFESAGETGFTSHA